MSLLEPQLEAFLAIVQAKTVHGAARLLHLTQTAVTQRIRMLEQRLHTTLFIRTRRGMALTTEGEALLHYCQAAKELEGAALAKICGAAIESNITLCISGPTSLMESRVIPQCLRVTPKFPRLLLHFHITDIEERHKLLRQGKAQLAVLPHEEITGEMVSKPLQAEKYVLVCSAAWHKRRLEDIIRHERIVDFAPSDTMTFNYLKHYKLQHLAKHERHFVNRTDALAMMISSESGYGVLTREFSEPYVQRGELKILNDGKVYQNPLALAWFPRPEMPPYFAALIANIC